VFQLNHKAAREGKFMGNGESNGPKVTSTQWTAGLPPLRLWQEEALSAWVHSGQKGVVVAATGTGKTRVALEAFELNSRIVVVVPTIALQDQWRSLLRYKMKLSPKILGLIGGRNADFNLDHQVVLSVLDSARLRLPEIIRYWNDRKERILLIVDECHRLGSDQALDLLKSNFQFSLGLSATPQNDGDGFDDQIENGLGGIIYELPLRRALDENMLAPLRVLDIYFKLPPSEVHEFEITASKIATLRSALAANHPELREESANSMRVLQGLASHDSRAKQALSLMQQNRRLVANSKSRRNLFDDLVKRGVLEDTRTIVFNETIEQAENALQILKDLGIQAVIDHSKVPVAQRKTALERFSSGSSDILVTVRTVDEGIDVPDANLAIIVSGTLTKRQRVQRIGRVIRPGGGVASVISILARGTTEEYVVGMSDPELLGPERVRVSIETPDDELLAWVKGLGD
jgi:superfamily II DNA or RNA helicase